MEFLNHFISISLGYAKEIWFSVLLGFVVSGFIHQFLPASWVERHLGEKGFKPILLSSLVGMLLPVCCVGSLPIAVTMQKKGARLGPILAFLITTPGTSVPALLICWKLLGSVFTIYIFFAILAIGLLIGALGNYLNGDIQHLPELDTGKICIPLPPEGHRTLKEKIQGAFFYSFVTLPKGIGLELLIGILLASLIMIVGPVQDFIQQQLTGAWGYLVIVVVSLVTYVCETANVPLAHALLKSGMSNGQVMTYLLIGPVTSYGTILVLKKSFGFKVMVSYLVSLSLLSVLSGLLFDFLL